MNSKSALVRGTGLLGASMGLALRAQGWRVGGWDPDPSALAEALRRGAIELVVEPGSAFDAELIVLAAPPEAIIHSLGEMQTGSLVTDVAGIKASVVTAASHLPHFVGGHPMAGGETSGPGMAQSSMFHGARWILTTDGADEPDLATMSEIVRSLGANPVVMTAAEHDAAVARVSHLPHVLAAALVQLADEDGRALDLAGGGFRDLTRVAAADSGWWSEVLTANATELVGSLEELKTLVEAWQQSISSGDDLQLRRLLDRAREIRAGLGEHDAQVRVVLLDRPGEIARVGHALEGSRVDVRDFQIRHGEHGGGGVLTISVRKGGREALSAALRAEGFELQGEP